MSDTGRYFVRLANGRTFCVEPIQARVHEHRDWDKGNQPVEGGAVREADSIITPENGFTNIQVVANPMDVIDAALRESR